MLLTLVRASLFSKSQGCKFDSPFFTSFFYFGTAHALCFAPVQGTLFPLPHVWLDFFVYTYKFTFDHCIITTQMSFLYAPTTSDCRPLPMMSSLSDPFRLHPNLVLRYFRFPFDYPSPPIRRLLEQWGPNRLPMLLTWRGFEIVFVILKCPVCCCVLFDLSTTSFKYTHL